VVVRQPCVLAAPKIRFYEKAAAEKMMKQACSACPAE
jgi:indolepyruvate ferredoxin oxidoreductase alpha subunit